MVEHVFAQQKSRMGLFVGTIGIACARTKIGMATLPTISPASSGTRGELRPHNGECGENRRRNAEINQPSTQARDENLVIVSDSANRTRLSALPFKNRGKSICPVVHSALGREVPTSQVLRRIGIFRGMRSSRHPEIS
ncbi:hypothetical protein [Mesorhizobium sophorae]|uniref:hypothetical protein n=1 Tax=Mesorhizobium sophorae TaxID=1300294 RepID=UPI003CC9E331